MSLRCINIVEWSRCKETSASRPFHRSHCSNQQYLLFQSVSTFFTLVFLTLSLSFLAFVPSFCFICLSYRLPLFSSCVPVITCFSTPGSNSRLCPSPSLLALLTALTAPCLCVCIVSGVHHLSSHDSDSWIEPYNPEITRQLCCELIRSVFSVERDSVDRSHTGHWNKNERVFSVLAPVIWQTTVHTQIHTLTERTTHIFTQMNIPAELQSHSVTVTSNICSPTHSSCSLPVSLPVAEW